MDKPIIDLTNLSFEQAQGLYWYCARHHSGQGSMEYAVLCQLGYGPGLLETGPEEGPALDFYRELAEAGDFELAEEEDA